MAGIKTAIALTDQMSAPLQHITNAMNMMLSSWDDLRSRTSSGLDVEGTQAIRSELEQATEGLENMNNEQQQFTQEVNRSASATGNLMGKIVALVGAYATVQSAKKVMDISDELTSTMARLDMMNDGLQTTDQLFDMVYQAAQNSRGSVSDMAAVVAKFGNNAKDAFSSSSEVVQFSELVQKQMTIAGASTSEASNAMLQLSQALGSGTLRGDELNSIFEQAPNLIQSIADYLDVGIGEIRTMASEGKISADVVKAAIFASADDINAKFEAMPQTWSQTIQSFKNQALVMFQPILQKVNDIANSEGFQTFATNAMNSLSLIANFALEAFEAIANAVSWLSDNFDTLAPIIMGVAVALGAYALASTGVAVANGIHAASEAVKAAQMAIATGATFAETAAQYGLNAALAACPITWIVVAVIALIAAIAAVCSWIAKTTGIAQTGFGVITGGINVAIQAVKNAALVVANVGIGIWSALGAVCSNIGTAFHNVISNVQGWFYGLLSTALTVVAGICEALNKLPFVEFDYSGITSKADEYASKSASAYGNTEEYTSVADAFSEGFGTFDTFTEGWASDAFESGAAWGDGVADKISGFFKGSGSGTDSAFSMDEIATGVGDIATNTGSTADSLSASTEELKYLRDIAEQEAINRFTTAEVKVDLGGVTNNVNSNMDIDGVIDYLTSGVSEALEMVAEGVHS